MFNLEWMSLVVGKLSPWITVDHEDANVRMNSEKVSLTSEVCVLS